jgi:hypothetical protein
VADLPPEIVAGPRSVGAAISVADELYDRLVQAQESFWSTVYPPFMARDITRADLLTILRKGLQRTGGSYKMLVQLFNMPPRDYKRFLNFLRKHGCHLPFHAFRTARPPDVDPHAPAERRESTAT